MPLTQWEYTLLSDASDDSYSLDNVMSRLTDQVNELGSQGWELVNHAITDVLWAGQVYYTVTVSMKRPIDD